MSIVYREIAAYFIALFLSMHSFSYAKVRGEEERRE